MGSEGDSSSPVAGNIGTAAVIELLPLDEVRVRLVESDKRSGVTESFSRHNCDDSGCTHGGSVSPVSCGLC